MERNLVGGTAMILVKRHMYSKVLFHDDVVSSAVAVMIKSSKIFKTC